MSKTVKEVLKEVFEKFRDKAKLIVANEQIDKLNEFDEEDLLYALDMLLFLFPSDNTEYHLIELLNLKNIVLTEIEIKNLCPLIEKLIEKLKEIKSLL
jgi:hypothetical protein